MNSTLTASVDAAQTSPDIIEFLDARFDRLDIEQTAARCASIGRAPFRYVVTPNVDHIVTMHREPETYKANWDGAWLSVCDSRILQLLAKFSGLEMPVVPGSDLTAYLYLYLRRQPARRNGGQSHRGKRWRDRRRIVRRGVIGLYRRQAGAPPVAIGTP